MEPDKNSSLKMKCGNLNEKVRNSLRDTSLEFVNKQKKAYTDDIFPPEDSSIGFEYSKSAEEENEEYLKTLSPFIQNVIRENELLTKKSSQFVFKRISELFSEFYINRVPETYCKKGENYTMVDDILQGDLGDCYFLSVISAIAEYPKRIINLFTQKTKNPYGCYEIKVNIEGEIIKSLVDDYFPCVEVDENEYKLAFTNISTKSLNIWPLLLEKVWAKVNGSYNNIIEGCASQAFDFLTPAPVDIFFHMEDNNIDLFAKIQDSDQREYIICCDTSEKPGGNYTAAAIESLGLITNHAYTVISAYIITNYLGEKVQLLKLRNPWGKLEWNGDWSDNSEKWTPILRKEVGLSDEDDGTFFMDFKDYFKFFSCSYICNYHDDYSFRGKHMKFEGSNPYFFNYVDFKEKNHCYIIVNLKNSKIYQNITKNKDYQNPYCNLSIYKLIEQGGQSKLKFAGNNASRLDRIYVELQAEPGRYLLIVNFPKDLKKYAIEYEDYKECYQNFKDEFTFHVGIYAHPSVIADFIPIPGDKEKELVDNYGTMVQNLIIDRATADKKKDYFYNENEVTTWRSLNFERETEGTGYFVYKNDSNALIKEKVTFSSLNNIQIIPLIKQGEGKLLDEDGNIDFFEDRNEAKLIKDLKEIVEYKSDYKISVQNPSIKIGDNNPITLEISVAPKSYYVLVLEKYDEFAEIRCSSQIILKYELDFLLSERKFLEKKSRLKYRENFIDIFESVINHPAGVIFKYKNKTAKHKLEAKIYFDKHKNLTFNDSLSDYFTQVQNEKEYDTKLVKKEKNYVNLIVHPGQCMFMDFSVVNDYEVFSYETKIDYLISIVGDFTGN